MSPSPIKTTLSTFPLPASSPILPLLSSHLPHSLALYRRLQSTSLPYGTTPTSQLLYLTTSDSKHFTVAYLDLSHGTETEFWIFSTFEEIAPFRRNQNQDEYMLFRFHILELFSQISILENEYRQNIGPRPFPGVVLGTLNEHILAILREEGKVIYETEPHHKFIFRKEDLPVEKPLPEGEGFSYGTVRREDMGLVLSRTGIPYKAESMAKLPSVAVIKDGEPIAWGFVGLDGSLKTLHCEEPYRGKGIAKAISQKLFREHLKEIGPEELFHSDVSVDNLQSQGVCKSLGGKAYSKVHWVRIKL